MAFLLRAIRAELLASEIYLRIFLNCRASRAIANGESGEGLWRRRLQNRRTLWGRSIDLNVLPVRFPMRLLARKIASAAKSQVTVE